MTDRATISVSRLIALSLPTLAFVGYDLARRSYLAPYLSQDLGLQMGVVGWLVLLANLASIPAELLVGAAGDRGSARFGRRRLWVFAGTLLILSGIVALLALPGSTGIAGGALVVLVIGWAMCNVAHGAWALEIARDDRERARVFGLRTVFGLAGAIGFSALAAALAGSRTAPFVAILIPAGVGALLFHALLIATVPEPASAPAKWRLGELAAPIRLLFAHRDNRQLAALFALNGMHAAITGTSYFYVVGDALALPGFAATGILIQMVCAAAGIALAIRYGARLGGAGLLRPVLWANLVLALALPLVPPHAPAWLILWSLPFGFVSAVDFMALRMLLGTIVARDPGRAAAHYAGFHLPYNLFAAIGAALVLAEFRFLGFDPRGEPTVEQAYVPVLLLPSLAAAATMAASLWILARTAGSRRAEAPPMPVAQMCASAEQL